MKFDAGLCLTGVWSKWWNDGGAGNDPALLAMKRVALFFLAFASLAWAVILE